METVYKIYQSGELVGIVKKEEEVYPYLIEFEIIPDEFPFGNAVEETKFFNSLPKTFREYIFSIYDIHYEEEPLWSYVECLHNRER